MMVKLQHYKSYMMIEIDSDMIQIIFITVLIQSILIAYKMMPKSMKVQPTNFHGTKIDAPKVRP
jgi:hypothetical protein